MDLDDRWADLAVGPARLAAGPGAGSGEPAAAAGTLPVPQSTEAALPPQLLLTGESWSDGLLLALERHSGKWLGHCEGGVAVCDNCTEVLEAGEQRWERHKAGGEVEVRCCRCKSGRWRDWTTWARK